MTPAQTGAQVKASHPDPGLDSDFFTGGVMSRRCVAWVFDAFLIAVLVWVLWWILVMFGLLTFGLGFGAMSILPFVPFCYNFLSLLGALGFVQLSESRHQAVRWSAFVLISLVPLQYFFG